MRPKYQTSFARRLGRSLSPRQQQLLQEDLTRLQANPATLHPNTALHIEIGFGNGEHLLARAVEAPDTLFAGCEPYLNGVVSLLAKIKEQQVKNIRIHTEDARLFLDGL